MTECKRCKELQAEVKRLRDELRQARGHLNSKCWSFFGPQNYNKNEKHTFYQAMRHIDQALYPEEHEAVATSMVGVDRGRLEAEAKIACEACGAPTIGCRPAVILDGMRLCVPCARERRDAPAGKSSAVLVEKTEDQVVDKCEECNGTGIDQSVKHDGPEKYQCPACRPLTEDQRQAFIDAATRPSPIESFSATRPLAQAPDDPDAYIEPLDPVERSSRWLSEED